MFRHVVPNLDMCSHPPVTHSGTTRYPDFHHDSSPHSVSIQCLVCSGNFVRAEEYTEKQKLSYLRILPSVLYGDRNGSSLKTSSWPTAQWCLLTCSHTIHLPECTREHTHTHTHSSLRFPATNGHLFCEFKWYHRGQQSFLNIPTGLLYLKLKAHTRHTVKHIKILCNTYMLW